MAEARNEIDFDPDHHQQGPVRALTYVIRGLRMGARVRLPNGTVVRSIEMIHGAHRERRFAVIPPEEASTALDRHRALALGMGACRTASEAAMKALDKGEDDA